MSTVALAILLFASQSEHSWSEREGERSPLLLYPRFAAPVRPLAGVEAPADGDAPVRDWGLWGSSAGSGSGGSLFDGGCTAPVDVVPVETS